MDVGGNPVHSHTVSGTTDSGGVNHSHTVDVPAFVGVSSSPLTPDTGAGGTGTTGSTGVTGVGANMMPYQIINGWIVRT